MICSSQEIELDAIQIPVNVSVRFTNLDRGKTYEVKSTASPKDYEFKSDNIEPETSYTATLTKPGEYEYELNYVYGRHRTQRMKGKIVVK